MRKVSRNQMGAYLCIASNDVPPAVSKRVILNVNCKYNINQMKLVVKYRNNVVLSISYKKNIE